MTSIDVRNFTIGKSPFCVKQCPFLRGATISWEVSWHGLVHYFTFFPETRDKATLQAAWSGGLPGKESSTSPLAKGSLQATLYSWKFFSALSWASASKDFAFPVLYAYGSQNDGPQSCLCPSLLNLKVCGRVLKHGTHGRRISEGVLIVEKVGFQMQDVNRVFDGNL